MATLNLKSIATLVSNQAAAMQAASSTLLDFTTGAVLTAFIEANAAIAVWLQSLVLVVLAASRLATSRGVDVDTFVADFGLSRTSSTGATGQETFGRYSTDASALIPVGATVGVPGTDISFTVLKDTGNAAYVDGAGYLLQAGQAEITLPVASVSTGPQTNVRANTVTSLSTVISGVDYVYNPDDMTGGTSAESDASVKYRFALFILGLSRGNVYGVESALANLGPNVKCKIVDQHYRDGTFAPGFFFVVVDDGTGTPGDDFMTAATNAVWAYRALGIRFGVYRPTINNINVSLTVSVIDGFSQEAVEANVGAAIRANIVALGLGAGLQVTQIAAWAWAIPGVKSVITVQINGVAGDAADLADNEQVRLMPSQVIVDVY